MITMFQSPTTFEPTVENCAAWLDSMNAAVARDAEEAAAREATAPLTPERVAALIARQDETYAARVAADLADDVAFVASAIGTAEAVDGGMSVSAIVRAIKASGRKCTLSVPSSIKYHLLTGRVLRLATVLPDGSRDTDGYEPREIQTAIKGLTNGGMTREVERAIKDAETVRDVLLAIEALYVERDARLSADTDDDDTDDDTDDTDGQDVKPPRVKSARDYLKAIAGPIGKLSEMTATADQAAAARELIAMLSTFAATAPVQSGAVVGESTTKVGGRAMPRQRSRRTVKSF